MFGMAEFLKERQNNAFGPEPEGEGGFELGLDKGEYKELYNENPNKEQEQLDVSAKKTTVPVQTPTLDVEETPGVGPADIPEEEFKKGKGLLNIGGSEGMPGVFGKMQKWNKQGGLLGKAMKGMNEDLTDEDVTSKIGELTDTFTGGESLGSMLKDFGKTTGPETTTSTIQNAANTGSGRDEYSQSRPQGAYF